MRQSEISRRRDLIVNLLSSYGELSAGSLADMLKVTVQTVRADLRALDEGGLVRRRHGVANLATPTENLSYQPRLAVSRAEKDRIGAAVAELIPAGASVAMGTGTTVEACARALARHEGLTVFTNNIHAVLALRAAPGISLSLAGGVVRLRDLDFVGAESTEFFSRIKPDHAIYSLGGVAENGQLLDFNMDEIRARRAIHDCARNRIIVIDHTKIGRLAHYSQGLLWDAETIVCSGALPELTAERLRAEGRSLICV
ncbi:DeoR/GlpR family DNA-binding transcription regulator [Paracoccus sp. MBLB3053]|uniref:DeoR/GlpR family DNA-binding transcription regulator n=1 Tax=Paracoccus aurantius TaxID=3073814 RepID=A0ABU2HZL6_9RHOB|nr:DeoR/GlpR family DNA-binding transcription regulator [Paracoccus sp. MBLB3053]MDS9470049.1 DeoR/GlpR family DNA-binding transcription regulator [Paracoccus sp. MBLB3053]